MKIHIHPTTIGIFFAMASLGAYAMFVPPTQSHPILILLCLPILIHIGAAIFTECQNDHWMLPTAFLQYHLEYNDNKIIYRAGLGVAAFVVLGIQLLPNPNYQYASPLMMNAVASTVVPGMLPIPAYWVIYQFIRKTILKYPGLMCKYIAWAGLDLVVIMLVKITLTHPFIQQYALMWLPPYFWPVFYLIYTASANFIYRRYIPPGIYSV